jgi:hypothetical protein
VPAKENEAKVAQRQLEGEEYVRAFRAADEWTRARTMEVGQFYRGELRRYLAGLDGGTPGEYAEAAKRIIEDLPNVRRLGGRWGYARSGLLPRHTLQTLVEFARGRVDPAKAAPKGRRKCRELQDVTLKQFADIQRARHSPRR